MRKEKRIWPTFCLSISQSMCHTILCQLYPFIKNGENDYVVANFKFVFISTGLLGLVVWTGCVYGQDEEDGEDGCPEFVCPEENGNFADPCQCRRFYICASGIPTKS